MVRLSWEQRLHLAKAEPAAQGEGASTLGAEALGHKALEGKPCVCAETPTAQRAAQRCHDEDGAAAEEEEGAQGAGCAMPSAADELSSEGSAVPAPEELRSDAGGGWAPDDESVVSSEGSDLDEPGSLHGEGQREGGCPGAWPVGGLTFFADFDSANCGGVYAYEAPLAPLPPPPAAPEAPPTPVSLDVAWAEAGRADEAILYEVVQPKCMVHAEPTGDSKVVTRKSNGARFFALSCATLQGWQKLRGEKGWVCVTDADGATDGLVIAQACGTDATATVRPYQVEDGTLVALSGLKGRPELNGQSGVVQHFVREKQRYAVQVRGTGESLLLRPGNLHVLPADESEVRSEVEAAGQAAEESACNEPASTSTPASGSTSGPDDAHFLTFDVLVRPDAAGTPFERIDCQWFYFGMSGEIAPGQTLRFRVLGLSRFRKLRAANGPLLTDGLRPVVCALGGGVGVGSRGSGTDWSFVDGDGGVELNADGSLAFVFEHTPRRGLKLGEELYFALTYPYPLRRIQEFITALRPKLISRGAYVKREHLTDSLDGRRVELLTVTSRSGGSRRRAPALPGLPARGSRPRTFPGRRSIFVSARVHPGETPASFILEGLLGFLCSKSPGAEALLQRYVFHIVPVLNPDGVARGHHRTDTLGENLNRVYGRATPEEHPSIAAAEAACSAAHGHQGGLRLYLDLHAHSNRRGAFLLADGGSAASANGGGVGGGAGGSARLFGYALARRCGAVEFAQSDFEEAMPGTGKSVVAALTGCPLCFTVESSYTRGHHSLEPFDPSTWLALGRACLEALLDLDRLERPLPSLGLDGWHVDTPSLDCAAGYFADGGRRTDADDPGCGDSAASRGRPLFGSICGPLEGQALSHELLMNPDLIGKSVEFIEESWVGQAASRQRHLRLHDQDGGIWIRAADIAFEDAQRGRFFYGVLAPLEVFAEAPSSSARLCGLSPGTVIEADERRVVDGELRARVVADSSRGSATGWVSEYRTTLFDPRLGGEVQLMRLRRPPKLPEKPGPYYAFPI